jgi:hypothetical protein
MQHLHKKKEGQKIYPEILLFAAAVIGVTVQKGIISGHPGNFLLFRETFHRLISGVDIYHPPAGEMSFFLYSPVFPLIFAPFAVLPLAIGLLLWNAVNAFALYSGISQLLPARAARIALLIVFLDLLRSLQNSQSNGVVAGLIVLAFVALERERSAAGAAAILAGFFIKIYPLGAGVLGLIRPRPWRFLGLSVALGLLFAALPLIVLPPAGVVAIYREWLSILQRDSTWQGQSVMRLLSVVLGSNVPTWPIEAAGTLLLLAPLIAQRTRWSDAAFRLRWLCSLLVFFVVFNHQAESASFVVSSTGLAIWYATSDRAPWRTALVGLMLVVESLPHLFFIPAEVYNHVIYPNALDIIPCLLLWLVIQVELWRAAPSRPARDEEDVSSGEALTHLA